MTYIGCKHLDYGNNYPQCQLITIEPEGWKYWKRLDLPYDGAPSKVQFCKKKGRINGIFACINPGEMCCFEAQEEK